MERYDNPRLRTVMVGLRKFEGDSWCVQTSLITAICSQNEVSAGSTRFIDG